MLFECSDIPDFILGVEICEICGFRCLREYSLLRGATIIANLSASNEIVGKAEYRRELVKSQSSRLICGYVYADAGEGSQLQI